MKQTKLFSFGKPPLPRGYSPSHILTYRNCKHKFLLSYVYKVKVEKKNKHLSFGSDIHEDISNGIFISDDTEKQKMLDIAKNFLSEMPNNPIFETNFNDKNNPGVYKGKVFDLPFLAVFDVHWIEGLGVDWKSGKYDEKYNGEYEIQAYILNELFKQRHGYSLNNFYFVFLKDGFRYEAQSIYDGNVRKRTETKIKNALNGIHELKFNKSISYSCEWCDYREFCI